MLLCTPTKFHGFITLGSNAQRGYGSWVCLCVCVSVTLRLTSRVFVRLTKDATYLTGNKGQNFKPFSLKLLRCKARAQKKPICIHTMDGMAYHSQIDTRALRTSEAPEDATQGVYRISHAI